MADYLMVIVRRKWAVVVIFLATVTLASLVSLRMPRVYETAATVKISQRIPGQNILATFYYDPYFLETEIEMIRSRGIMMRVANRLGLTYRVVNLPPHLADTVKEVTVAEGTAPGEFTVKFLSPRAFAVSAEGKELCRGAVGERVECPFGSITVVTAAARAGDKFQIQIKNVDAAVAFLRAAVTVRPIENVNMVRISARGRDPKQVMEVANAVADVYVAATLEEKRLQAKSTRMFIEEQIERTAENLREAERALEDFKRTHGIVDMDAETKHYATVISSLESDLLKDSLERQIDAVELGMLKDRVKESTGDGVTFPTEMLVASRFAGGGPLAQLETRLISLQQQRSELLKTMTPDHPAVRALDEEIASTHDELARALDEILERGELATNVELADERRKVVTSAIERYRALTARLPQKQMELNRLNRAYEVNEKVYGMLLEKLQEAKINEAMETADIRVVDYAVIPKAPISPNYVKNIIVGILLGVFLGLAVAYALEFADTSLNSVEEVERRLGRPVIGIIPRIVVNPLERVVGHRGEYDTYFITHTHPKSPVAEGYRTMRTAVLASGVDVGIRTLLITSTGLSEGKTNTAFNLAIVFAQAGNKVLLMDCDLRRAKAHRALGIKRAPGLAEVVMDRADVAAAIRPTEIENLFVLPSGEVPPNPSELLGSKKFARILGEVAPAYERVVMDAPPVLAVADALVLSNLVDGVCYVICAGRTDRNAAKRGLALLERTGCKILGVVFNQVEMTRVFGAYGYKYYSQYYQAYKEGGD